MNTDNYIFRSIKLEKELNKIKKKIHEDMSKEQLRMLLPYEQFLRQALKDQSEVNSSHELLSIQEEGSLKDEPEVE